MWSAVLEDPLRYGGTAVFVAEREGEVIGFGACGSQRDEALRAQGFEGEIGAVYVLRTHQGAGAGRALMRLMARRMLADGRAAASLWVLTTNAPARAFYEKLGGTLEGEKAEDHDGTTLHEVAYGWRDLGALAA